MNQLDLVQLAALGASDPKNGREAIEGIIITDGAAIATDGHMLVRVQNSPNGLPRVDAQKVLSDATAAATHHSLYVDPAKLAHLCKTLIEVANEAKKKKAPPRESFLQLKVSMSNNPLHALVFELELSDGRKVQALLMPLRGPEA